MTLCGLRKTPLNLTMTDNILNNLWRGSFTIIQGKCLVWHTAHRWNINMRQCLQHSETLQQTDHVSEKTHLSSEYENWLVCVNAPCTCLRHINVPLLTLWLHFHCNYNCLHMYIYYLWPINWCHTVLYNNHVSRFCYSWLCIHNVYVKWPGVVCKGVRACVYLKGRDSVSFSRHGVLKTSCCYF